MDNISVSIGAKIASLIAKGMPSMLKQLAKRIAPFETKNITIRVQPYPQISFNQEESICELRVCFLLRNNTTYDLEIQAGDVEMLIGSNVFTKLALSRMVTVLPSQEYLMVLSKPLTEFEYVRALKLFGNQSIRDCQFQLFMQGETVYGTADLTNSVNSTVNLLTIAKIDQ